MTRMFAVTLERDDDNQWIVSDSFSLCYGHGKDPTHALFSWLRDLDRCHRQMTLAEREGRLGKAFGGRLANIRDILSP